jgi:hypothetical protein
VGSGGAQAGATSFPVSGLAASGTLKTGTRFDIAHSGNYKEYVLTADAVIASGAATLKPSPALLATVTAGQALIVQPWRKSLYNKRSTKGLFFSDADLQDFARQARSTRGHWITTQRDIRVALFRAIRFYAWSAMLSSDEYLSAVLSDNTGAGIKVLEAKRTLLAEDEAIVFRIDDARSVVELRR